MRNNGDHLLSQFQRVLEEKWEDEGKCFLPISAEVQKFAETDKKKNSALVITEKDLNEGARP